MNLALKKYLFSYWTPEIQKLALGSETDQKKRPKKLFIYLELFTSIQIDKSSSNFDSSST